MLGFTKIQVRRLRKARTRKILKQQRSMAKFLDELWMAKVAVDPTPVVRH